MSIIIDATLRCNGCGHEVPVRVRPNGTPVSGSLPRGWGQHRRDHDHAHTCKQCNTKGKSA